MTAERADDKCEKCGLRLKEPAVNADFEDVLLCKVCMTTDDSIHIATYCLREPT